MVQAPLSQPAPAAAHAKPNATKKQQQRSTPQLNDRIMATMERRSVAAHPWHDLEIGTHSSRRMDVCMYVCMSHWEGYLYLVLPLLLLLCYYPPIRRRLTIRNGGSWGYVCLGEFDQVEVIVLEVKPFHHAYHPWVVRVASPLSLSLPYVCRLEKFFTCCDCCCCLPSIWPFGGGSQLEMVEAGVMCFCNDFDESKWLTRRSSVHHTYHSWVVCVVSLGKWDSF